MARTALIVPVPQAEPLVGEWRARYDSAQLGVPAHITLLVPFVPTERLDDDIREELRELFAAQPQISFSLTRLTDFPDETLWLAPEPAEPFRRLTELIVEHFPDYPPYEGIHDEIIPHLTIASRDLSRRDELEAAITPHLPIEAEAQQVTLLVEDEAGHWRAQVEFPLTR